MKYESKVFNTFYDLTKFLNDEDITPKEIINISVFSRGVALIYLTECEGENEHI